MKKILIIAVILISGIGAQAQSTPCGNMLFPTIDSLQAYISRFIRNSAINAFTDLRLNTAMIGTVQYLRCLQTNGIDSISTVDAAGSDPDTLKVYRKGVFAFYKLLPAGGGTGTNNTSSGTGYRLQNLGTQQLRDMAAGWGGDYDTTTSGVLRYTVDSVEIADTLVSTQTVQQLRVGGQHFATVKPDVLYTGSGGKVYNSPYYVASDGDNGNPGITAELPKLTIAGTTTLANTHQSAYGWTGYGLKAGSTFREQLDAVGSTKVRSFSYGQNNRTFAKISGMDAYNSGWTGTVGQANVYEQAITHTINTANPGYHYIFVAEIDTTIDKIYPFLAVKYLPLAASLVACNSTDGSFYMDGLNASTETIYINPTGTAAPGSNRYRYEVVTRTFAIDATGSGAITSGSPSKGVFENLIVQSSGHGYGMIGSGDSTVISHVIFWGGGTHSAVIANGYVGNSLFLPGPHGLSQGEIPIVIYKPDAAGAQSVVYSNIFLGTQGGPYAHQSGTGAGYHRKITYDGNYVFGDTGYTLNAYAADLVDTVVMQNNYAENVHKYWSGVATDLVIENNVINGVNGKSGIDNPSNLTVRALLYNNLIKTRGNSNNQTGLDFANGFYFVNSNVSLKANNNIFHLKTDWEGTGNPVQLFSTLPASTQFKYNIIICDVPTGHRASIISIDRNAQGGFASDSNVYVIVRGDGFFWTVTNPIGGDPNITTLANWTTEVGDDAASKVIDLRDNVNGLKDLFIDPDNGNYNFANTLEADTVKALFAGMITPPRSFPRRPAPDEAAKTVMNDEVANANTSAWQLGLGSSTSTELADGSETKVTAGTNVTVTGTGTIASPYVINSTGGGSATSWEQGGNTLTGTTDIGSLSNHNVRIVTNSVQRGAWTSGGIWLWNIPLGTENANYNMQAGGSMSIGGNAISQTGFLLQNTITASANSQQLKGLEIIPAFSTGGFTGVTAVIGRFVASWAGDLAFAISNTDPANDAVVSVGGANGQVNVSSAYGVYAPATVLHVHSANSQYITFNVGLYDEKVRVTESGLRLISTGYINFSTTDGSGGIGFRVNGGVMEWKDNGGAWNPFANLAPLASPTFTGVPAVPTAANGTNTTQAASTAFVQGELTGMSWYATYTLVVDKTFAGTTAEVVTFDTEENENGITHSTVTNPEEITFPNAGVYEISLDGHVFSSDGADAVKFSIQYWDGDSWEFLANSAALGKITSANNTNSVTLSYQKYFAASDKIRIVAAATSTNCTLNFIAADANGAATPAARIVISGRKAPAP